MVWTNLETISHILYIYDIYIMPGYCMGVVGSSIISILHSISMVGHFEKEFVFLPYNFMYEFSIYVRSWIDLWCHSVYKMSEILFQFTLEPTNCDWIYWWNYFLIDHCRSIFYLQWYASFGLCFNVTTAQGILQKIPTFITKTWLCGWKSK